MKEGGSSVQDVGRCAGASTGGVCVVCGLARKLEGPPIFIVVSGRGKPPVVDPMCPFASQSAGEEAGIPGKSSMTSRIAAWIMSSGIETPSGRSRRTRRWLFTPV